MSDIVWGGVRDLDPLEAERFREYEVQQFSVDDIRGLSDNLKKQMDTLSANVDAIYVHIDMDVLDPDEVPGHDLRVKNGPTSEELAAAMTLMFKIRRASRSASPRRPPETAIPRGDRAKRRTRSFRQRSAALSRAVEADVVP